MRKVASIMIQVLMGFSLFFPFYLHASIFNSETCPTTSMQTWKDSGGDVHFKNSAKVVGSNGEVGFLSIDDKENHSDSCDGEECVPNPLLILEQKPDFSIPSDAISLDNITISYTLNEGTYSVNEIKLAGNEELTINGEVVIYVNKMDLSGNASIDNDESDNLTIIGVGKSHIKLKSNTDSIHAHFVVEDHFDLEKDTKLFGSVIAKKAHIKNGSELHVELPEGCDTEEPIYSNDAQFEFGTKQCTSMPCTIDFTKDYDFAPLVFVMPTVPVINPDGDKPAALFVSSQLTPDSTSVEINQETVPINQHPNSTLMTEVSYLIIEPGVADFNGHEVIAGYVETDATRSKSGGNTFVTVEYSDFGKAEDFESLPVVLHQIQTRNNPNHWMTSGKILRNNDDDSEVRLFLELSASRDNGHTYADEKVAFLATTQKSPLEVNNYNVQFARGFETKSQGGSDALEDNCDHFVETDLAQIDGVIAKKQERAGSHGGWLRRCDIQGNEVSVVVDEDFADRGHIPEEVGYFAFESLATELPELCSYVPETLQTNHYANSPPVPWGALQVVGGAENKIFPVNNDPLYSFQNQPPITDLCSYPNGSVGLCTIDSTKTHNTLPMATPDFVHGEDDFLCDNNQTCQLESGDHKDVIIKENAQLTLTGGEYWVNELKFEEQNAQLIVLAPTVIHYKKIKFSKGNVKINNNGISENLLLIGHGKDSAVELPDLGGDTNFQFYAYFYVDPIATNATNGFVINGSNNKIYGGITAHSIAISGRKNHIYGRSEQTCDGTVPPANYSIVLTPSIDIALTCDDIPLTATVYKDGAVHNSYSGNITLSVAGQSDVIEAASSGVANFDLSYTQVSNVTATVSTTIEGEEYEDSGSYEFVPYLYELSADPLQVIAGKSQSFEIRPMECSSGGTPISSIDYKGVKTLDLSVVSYDSPSSPTNSAAISLLNASDEWVNTPTTGTLDFTANFNVINNQVVASSELIYPEAGEVSYSLSGEQCIEDENDELICKTFSGSQTVQSRPWTFAICSDDDISGNATDSTSTSYQAAGTPFAMKVKPIVWQDVSATDPIETSGYCSAAVTQNFFVSTAPSATLEMTYQVDTPSGGVDGDLTGTLIKNHSDKSAGGDYYDYAALSWDEVGSIRLLMDTQATYLGMDINQGYRNVGRFYPAFFKVTDTRWDYPNSLPHVYMGQPFDGLEFDVQALNGSNEAVENYSHVNYSDSLQAQFNLFENSGFSTRFVSPDFTDYAWALIAGSSIGTFTNTIANDCTDSICWNKSANFDQDGPFNATEAIEDSNITLDGTASVTNIDPIAFTTDGAVLTDQPDIRFGRINLKDVGGNQNTEITIPLTVEYWNGTRFITNTDDSFTDFDGANYCHQVIWSDLTDNASLAGSKNVEFGESRALVASQTTSAREQIRFWLTLHSTDGENGESDNCSGGDNGLSWLRYNWDGKDSDEEDPSTVVTFGIHRGNDRVIYRGESGLTGQ
ncbi:DUF6701 domain-containing protein [Vibrio amylolyticus]|uniref:DUF6701 domain-containing protein n=1 Tax=Vibrio amylolyticus TaxID=2847292 RepID=UPI00354FBFE6